MLETLNILYFEPSLLEVKKLNQALKKSHLTNTITSAKNLAEFESALSSDGFNLVLFEPAGLGSEGLRVLQIAQAKKPSLPVVVLTINSSVEEAVNYLKHGVADFIIKSPQSYRNLGQTLLNCSIKSHLKYSYPQFIQQDKSFREALPDGSQPASGRLWEFESRYQELVEKIKAVIYIDAI